MKKDNLCQHQDDTDVNAVIIKMLQWVISNTLEINEKLGSLSKEIENIIKEIKAINTHQKEVFNLKKYNNRNLKTQWIGSTAEKKKKKD